MSNEMIVILVLGFWVAVLSIVVAKVRITLQEKIDSNYGYLRAETERNDESYWRLRHDLEAMQDHMGVEFKCQERRVLVKKK